MARTKLRGLTWDHRRAIDPERRERMGALAKQRVARFQAKSVVPRIEQVYQELVRL